MNVGANEWKPSAGAATWQPAAAASKPAAVASLPGAVASKPAAVASLPGAVTSLPPPVPASAPPAARQESNSEDIEEDDPLWQVVLKIAEGDKDRALRMIGDPDSLTKYPEVVAVLNAMETDDWENSPEQVQTLVNEVDAMQIDEKAAPAPAPKPASRAPTPVEEEEGEETYDPSTFQEGDPREHLNLVFIGHVDAGKSTLSGNILYLTENVDKRTIERYEKEAKERNRESWFLAFIMDTNEEERAKGKTVEVGKAHFETVQKRYTIMDAPGHKNYVPNMIMGASQADIGILVVSARKGEFEAGFDRGGQTREHAMLAKTLGVSFLVVVVNKMDDPTVQWSKERYDECVTTIRPYLKKCGFVIKREVKFLPISGLHGANVKDEVLESECAWWRKCWKNGDNNTSSPTLLDLLDNSLEIKDRDPTAPIRLPVLERYSDRGTIAMGKVESGVIRPGMKITVMPTGNKYKVDAVWANEKPVTGARPGENVLIKLAGAGLEDVRKGFVICSDPPCRAVNKIICKIAVTDMPDNTKIMTAGFQAVFHAHCCEEECTVLKIFETTNSKGVVVKGARYASEGMQCVCMIELARTAPVETFEDMPFLGRFTLRTEGKTIAIGKITKLPPKK
jgi:peptide chain release factor subunit 3